MMRDRTAQGCRASGIHRTYDKRHRFILVAGAWDEGHASNVAREVFPEQAQTGTVRVAGNVFHVYITEDDEREM